MIRLIEAKQMGVLYHFTHVKSLEKILIDKGLKSYTYNFISFTRYWDEKQCVRIAFDGDRLSEKYKIRPFMDVDVEITKSSDVLYEAEEIIVWPIRTILPIVNNRYVIQIDILDRSYNGNPTFILDNYSNKFKINLTNKYSIVK